MTPPLLAVVTTVGNADDARRLAHAMVGQGLAACAQVSAIDSVYVWEGEVQQSPEFRLLFKTTEAMYASLEAALRAAHPYTLPALYAVAWAHVEPAFGAWVAAGAAGVPPPGHP